jgi:hypothetical protein
MHILHVMYMYITYYTRDPMCRRHVIYVHIYIYIYIYIYITYYVS